MEKYSDRDKEFINGVWSKVRYLEYMKNEEDKVRENAKRLRQQKLRLALGLLFLLLFTAAPLLLLTSFASPALIASGVLALCAGVCYEYFSEREIMRRI